MQVLNNVQISIEVSDDNDEGIDLYRFQPELKEAIDILHQHNYEEMPSVLEKGMSRKDEEFTDYIEISRGGLDVGILYYDEDENLSGDTEESMTCCDDEHDEVFFKIKQCFDPSDNKVLQSVWDDIYSIRINAQSVTFTLDNYPGEEEN